MQYYTARDDSKLAEALKQGAIGVLRTDTIYGIVAPALNQEAVERLYKVRHRSAHKRSIILIADESQLLLTVPAYTRGVLKKYWPGKVSIEMPIDKTVPPWLHRGGSEISHRMPADEDLRRLLAMSGPLIAPSANLEGQPPARSIPEAERYFGDKVDFYVDSGEVPPDVPPSALLRAHTDGSVEKLR